MEIISLNNIRNEIEKKQNQIELYQGKKELALMRILPKSTKLKEVEVESSLDVTQDRLLEYAAEIEEYDEIIKHLKEELDLLQEYEEKELKRLQKYHQVEQQVIAYKDKGATWRQISALIDQRKIACSLATARRIWKKYTNEQERASKTL